MATRSISTKMAEVHSEAIRAIQDRLGPDQDATDCILGVWAEPDGAVVLHINTGGNAAAAAHALWRRHLVESDLHRELGVLVWVV